MRLRSLLSAADLALQATIPFALVLPATAQVVPKSAVLGIASGATTTSAGVTVNDGTSNVLLGILNPTTHVFTPAGLAAEITRAQNSEAQNASAIQGVITSIANEVVRAQAAEATNATAILAEQARAIAAEATASLKANNLSDLASAATARVNLGLGSGATANIGTTTGTVADGSVDPIARSAVQPVGSIAALRVLPYAVLADKAMVNVAGFASVADGGGGLFVWSSSSTAADNGGTIINPTGNTGSGRWLRYNLSTSLNVMWFGAKGGGNDDLSAFVATQAAIPATGGTFYMPSPTGCYGLSGRFALANDQRHIAYRGESREASCVKYIGSTLIDSLIYQGAPANGLTYNAPLELSHFTLDGGRKVQWTLNLDYGQGTHVYDALVTGAATDATYSGSANIRLGNYGGNIIGPSVRIGAGGTTRQYWPSYGLIASSSDNQILYTGGLGAAVAFYLNTSGGNFFIGNHPFGTPVGFWATGQGSGQYVDNEPDTVDAIGYEIDSPNNYVRGGRVFSATGTATANLQGLLSIPVATSGGGYQSAPTIGLTGTFVATPSPQAAMSVQSASVSGGTGYAVGDVVPLGGNAGVVSGLTGALAPQLTVTAIGANGVPTAVSIKIAGQMATINQTAQQSAAPASGGTGATFTMNWGVGFVYVPHNGHGAGFSGTASASLTGGSPSTAATLGTPDYGNIGVVLGPYATNSSVEGVAVENVPDAAHHIALVNTAYPPAGTMIQNNPGASLTSGLFQAGVTGPITADSPDGTNTGGTSRGAAFLLDYCRGRSSPSHVETGLNSMCIGSDNTGTGSYGLTVAFGSFRGGAYSRVGGNAASDQYTSISDVTANGKWANSADNQVNRFILSATTTGPSQTSRLFTGGTNITSANVNSTLHQPVNTYGIYKSDVECVDSTTPANEASYTLTWKMKLGATSSTTSVFSALTTTPAASNAGTAPSFTLVPDTTYAGPNLSMISNSATPSGEVWRCTTYGTQMIVGYQ